jgi:U3 small nucleolar RNA-associated protein 20
MALWLGVGRKILGLSWDLGTDFGARLHGVLAEKELGWGGWKGVGLQGVLRVSGGAAAGSLSTTVVEEGLGKGMETKIIELSASLVRDGRITPEDVDAVWKERVGKWAGELLEVWEMPLSSDGEGNAEVEAERLSDILSLAPFVPSAHLQTHLSRIISLILDASQAQTPAEVELEYVKTHGNRTWVLGACLHALGKIKIVTKGAGMDVAGWVMKVVEKWAWSGWVLAGLVDVLKARYVFLGMKILFQ